MKNENVYEQCQNCKHNCGTRPNIEYEIIVCNESGEKVELNANELKLMPICAAHDEIHK